MPWPPKNAAERVAVDYEPLPAITATRAAPEGPRLGTRPTLARTPPSALRWKSHSSARLNVVALETTINRVTGVPMEPRAALASYDAQAGRYTVTLVRRPHRARAEIAGTLGVPEETKCAWVTRELGGNYGTRNIPSYPEFALARVGRRDAWARPR
jgi:carbon-monoxide dehydrogenase large subunit